MSREKVSATLYQSGENESDVQYQFNETDEHPFLRDKNSSTNRHTFAC
jgi:hypothetical protein